MTDSHRTIWRQYQRALQGPQTALSAELALGKEGAAAAIDAQVELFKGRVHGIQVTDSPPAWVSPSPLAVSALALQAGVDTIPLLTCRDRNRIALYSDLMGLHALGVRSVILGRGRRVPKNHALHASTVFDMTGRELIAMAAGCNEEDPLFIGTGVKAHRARQGWSAESLTARGEAGAQFIQTQLCFNLDLLKHWLDRLVEARMTWRYSVVVTLTPFPDLKTALWIRENLSDSKIPDAVFQRLEGAPDAEQEGIALCAETMRAVAEIPGVSGIHLMSTGSPELLARALDASGLRSTPA